MSLQCRSTGDCYILFRCVSVDLIPSTDCFGFSTALDRLRPGHLCSGDSGTVSADESVDAFVAFDVASLLLYGCRAIPSRLKILLDRLFDRLLRDQVQQILRAFGWSNEDYSRGYIIQESHGGTLDRWSICSPEEESAVLQQFLRFAETRPIALQQLFARRSPMNMHLAPAQMPPHHQKPPLGAYKMSAGPPPSPASAPGPLGRLQNMQPFDFRKLGALACFPAPDLAQQHLQAMRRRLSEAAELGLSHPQHHHNLNPFGLHHPHPASFHTGLLPPPIAPATSPVSPQQTPTSNSVKSDSRPTSDHSDEDENSHSALNLSKDAANRISRRPPRTPPAKRHWGSSAGALPVNLGTQFINPATGKKRVQCNVCLKTFCDKGALKIHFSAVHLREMHKCTVEGCSMMFSSRRSRNRHSANPNPKLHSPHLRRKISPHDGRSAQAHPVLLPPHPHSLPPHPFGPFPLLTPPPELRHPQHPHSLAALDFKHNLDRELQQRYERERMQQQILTPVERSESSEPQGLSSPTHEFDDADGDDEEDDDDDGGIVVVAGDDDESPSEPEQRDSMPAQTRPDSNEDSSTTSNIPQDAASPHAANKQRKRKSQNPTRCASYPPDHQILSEDESADEMMYTEPVQTEPQSLIKRRRSEEKPESLVSSTPPVITQPEQTEVQDLCTKPRSPDVNANERISATNVDICKTEDDVPRPSSAESRRSAESLDSANALRRLESLSHGHFGELMSRGIQMVPTGNAYPAVGGFLLGTSPPSPAHSRASSPDIDDEDDLGSSDDSPSDDNSEHRVYGRFENGTFITTTEIPIDKDNPRKCTACGKIFQNHFGVKTHYQNVHLKLMHRCTVDGCNAAFPSKRSRDRHSTNLNLHRKLLSTSTSSQQDAPALAGLLDKSPFPALHTEFLARLYADTQNLEAFRNQHIPPPPPGMLFNGDHRMHSSLLLPPPLGFGFHGLAGFNHLLPHLNGLTSLGRRSSGSDSPVSASSGIPDDVDDLPQPLADGSYQCRRCHEHMRDATALRRHFENVHPQDLHRCTVQGCNKTFMSRTKRDQHSEDRNAHYLQHTRHT
ncbi:zinc finger protein basonuclin-2-like [Ctenocephalides felis]|uniref:zinc finger protein basonuclin-2-like n=1 Tax=Ctenocephalides felis TaxID=7515 RepID=UPI000E6E316E|nr:zinc finger protein basonuclin-2-like [Ctenocephalides felis]